MADKYIGDITKKTPSITDYLVAVDGADAYQTLVSDVAKKIIEDYQGSNLGGVSQSIQAGFDVVGANNIVGANNRQGWTALTSGQDLNSVTSAGIYYANSAGIYNSVLNSPMTGKPFRLDVQYSIANNSYLRQIWTANTGEQFIRESINIGATWSEWRLTPTRAEVNAIANRGAKNLLQGMSGNSVTSNGITATKNADGSITLNGTATANFILVVGQFENTLNGERVTLTGCPEGGSGTTYVLRAYNEGTTIQNDYGSGVSFAVPNTNNFNVRIVIFKNTTVTDLTFYPMMRFASVQDDTYVPYGMSNAELTDKVKDVNTSVTATIGTVSSSFIARKSGGVVTVRCNTNITSGTPFSSVTSGTTIATLPEDYRPSQVFTFPIILVKGTAINTGEYKTAYLQVGTDGTIKIYGNNTDIQSANSIVGTVTFVTA